MNHFRSDTKGVGYDGKHFFVLNDRVHFSFLLHNYAYDGAGYYRERRAETRYAVFDLTHDEFVGQISKLGDQFSLNDVSGFFSERSGRLFYTGLFFNTVRTLVAEDMQWRIYRELKAARTLGCTLHVGGLMDEEGTIYGTFTEQPLGCVTPEGHVARTAEARTFSIPPDSRAAGLSSLTLQPSTASSATPPNPCLLGAEQVSLERAFRGEGKAWIATLPQLAHLSDNAADGRRSTIILCENGRPLGPAHSMHADIRLEGRGAFSHWETSVYFSTSDDTDPNTNGRSYIAVRP